MLLRTIASSRRNLCLIDAGNSRVKVRTCSLALDPGDRPCCDSFICETQAVVGDHTNEIQSGHPNAHYIIASVRGAAFTKLFRNEHAHIVKVPDHDSDSDLMLCYDTVENLGVDRWLAMFGAMSRSKDMGAANTLVIDIGTAITGDLICRDESGQYAHKGGWILPGADLQLAAINQTGRIAVPSGYFDVAQGRSVQAIGQSTVECVVSAIDHSAQGFISSIIHYCQNRAKEVLHDPRLAIVVTGGGYRRIFENSDLLNEIISSLPVSYVPELIFDGMQEALCRDEQAFATLVARS